MRTDHYREWDSAYVLGALPVVERLEFERHLETCESCVRSVNDLAGMPGILGRLGVEDALAVRDRGEETATVTELDGARVLRGLARQERAHRRRRLVGLAAACALCLGLGAAGVAALSRQDTGTTPSAIAMKPVGSSGMRAAITVAAKPWGTRMDWSCHYDKPWGGTSGASASRSYELVVTDKQGKEAVVATWKAGGTSARHLAASSSYQADDIRSVNIRRAGTVQPLAETSL